MTAGTTGRTFLVATLWTGHRLHFVRLLAERSLEQGSPVTILLPHVVRESREFAVYLHDLDEVSFVWLDGTSPFKAVKATLGSASSDDRAILPDGDVMLRALGKWLAVHRPRGKVTVLLTHVPYPGVTRGAIANARLGAKSGLIQAIRARGVSVRQLTDSTGIGQPHRLYRGLPQVPDPVPPLPLPPVDEARARVGIARDRFVVASLGVQRADKNPVSLIEAWKRSPVHRRAGVKPLLVLAGHQPDGVRADINERAAGDESILLHDDFLPSEMLGAYAAAADVIALVVRGHSMSSMLSLAIRARKPVLVAGNPRLCHLVRTLGLGVDCATDISSIAQGLDEIWALDPIEAWPDVATPADFAEAMLE